MRCLFLIRQNWRTHGASSQESGLSQKYSARRHGKELCPVTTACKLNK
jgi:hypothetical protein